MEWRRYIIMDNYLKNMSKKEMHNEILCIRMHNQISKVYRCASRSKSLSLFLSSPWANHSQSASFPYCYWVIYSFLCDTGSVCFRSVFLRSFTTFGTCRSVVECINLCYVLIVFLRLVPAYCSASDDRVLRRVQLWSVRLSPTTMGLYSTNDLDEQSFI